jgi:preprotein translocase subunit SecB
MSVFEEYKIISNAIQLKDVELVSMKCLNKSNDNNDNKKVTVKMQRKIEMENEKEATIFMRTIVGGEKDCPFGFDIVYKGTCVCLTDIDVQQFEQYAYIQVIPLLLPYVRECVSSTMARMALPVFTIPTIDILDSYEENHPVETREL